MGASSFSPSPITTMPSMGTLSSTMRMASTAAPSAPFLSPRPIQRDAARAAASVTRTSSMARLRSGRCFSFMRRIYLAWLNGSVGQLSNPYEQGDGDGPDGVEVVYELDDWSEIERQAVADRLREAGIAHGWEGTTLHVAAVDEAAVENVLDIVEGESAEPLDTAHDQVAYDLSDWDDDRLTALVDALDGAVDATAVPYGLAPRDWGHLQDRVTALCRQLRARTVDEDAVMDAARELRNALRPYV